VLGQELLAQCVPVVGERGEREQQDCDAPDQQDPALDVRAVVEHAAPQQHRHHQVVADHGGQRHAGHDHHAGRRRQAADVGGQRQPGMAAGERQVEHIGLARHRPGARQRLPGQRDRHHQRAEQQQVADEHPARRTQIGRILALDHRDMELPRQADDRGDREQGLGQEPGRQALQRERLHAFGDPWRQPVAVLQLQQREHADRHEGDQLDQRLQRDRQHHAAVVFGGIDAAGAEQDREHRQHQRHV
jgi:hypothetical protein